MTKYRIHGGVCGGKYVGEFEADSPNDALRKADDEGLLEVSVCFQCADEVGDPEMESFTIEDLDNDKVYYQGGSHDLRKIIDQQKNQIIRQQKQINKLKKELALYLEH
jgi:hypothetical protein